MNRAWIGLSLALVAVTVLPGCVNRRAQELGRQTEEVVTDPSVTVRLMTVPAGTLSDLFEVSGQIETAQDTTIAASVPGRLVSVLVRDGDRVSAGQVVARQETTEANARLQQALAQASAARSGLQQALTSARTAPSLSAGAVRAAEAQLAQARAQLEKAQRGARSEEVLQAESNVRRAKSDLDTARAARDRAARLFEEGAISQAAMEQAENGFQNAQAQYDSAEQTLAIARDAVRPEDLESARQAVRAAEENVRIQRDRARLDSINDDQVAAARANVQAAEEGVRLARKALADLVIRAPLTGVIQGKPAAVGTVMGPGTPFARLIGTGDLYFTADVPENRVSSLRMGMPVLVRIDSLSGVELNGTIASIDPKADSIGRLFAMRVSLKERPGALKVGMFGRGQVTLGRRANVAVVPESVLVREGNKTYVWLNVGGLAKRTEVTVGMRESGRVEVSGIAVGDEIVSQGMNLLREDAPLVVEQPGEAQAAPGAQTER